MNAEEYLDRLIERREHGEVQLPVINDEVAVSLAAAEVLVQLQEIDVPPSLLATWSSPFVPTPATSPSRTAGPSR